MKKRTLLSMLCLATALISNLASTVYAVETPSGDIVGSLGELVPPGTNQETQIPPNTPIPEASTPDPDSVTEEPQEDTVSNLSKEEQIEVPNKVVANPTENLTENSPVNDGSAETNLSEDGVVDDTTADYKGDIGTVHWLLKDGILHYGAGTLPNIEDENIYSSYSANIPVNIRDQVYRVVFDGKVIAGDSLCGFFVEFTNLEKIDKLENLDTTNVTNMQEMFNLEKHTEGVGTSYPSKLVNLDLSSFNTTNVTNMSAMFLGCSSLISLDVSNFDTSNVTSMNFMFRHCESLTSLNVSNFDTSKVTDMFAIFSYCISLTNLDITNFNTSNVTLMNHMFLACRSLTNLDLSNFNTSNVADMDLMFDRCISLVSLNISSFNTSSVEYMDRMFGSCKSLTSLDLSSFDTTNVVGMVSIFRSDSLLTHLKLGPLSKFSKLPPVTTEDGDFWRKDKAGLGYTNDELISQYDGSTMAGDWYWIPSMKVEPSVLYTGDTWQPTTNITSWLAKDGSAVPLNDITVAGTVDSDTPGDYPITYSYEGLNKSITMTVLRNQTAIKLNNSTVYLDDPWQLTDNFGSWIDKDGNSIALEAIAVTITKPIPEEQTIIDQVNTSVAGEYHVTFEYDHVSKEAIVTVLQSPNYSVQLPANLQFTKLNEPANGSDVGTAVNYTVKLVNTADKQAYSGETNVKVGVASANSWQLKDKENAIGATYQLTDGTGTDIGTSGYAFYLNKETNEKTLTANLTNKAKKSGNYFDTLTFTYGKEP